MKTALVGGVNTAVDGIDGDDLLDGDICHAFVSNVLYAYLLDDDSGAAESSPDIISPDANAGDKRWILQNAYGLAAKAASGANADITSMTGLDDGGIPLAKVDGAAASGANADITSMTGLNDDGIPVYKTALSMSDLYGCELSNGTDSDHDIDISAGQRRDTANGYNLVLAATLTKQIDAAFAAGDDAGGMFTGSVANSTWYHVHLIRKDSDGTIDAGFDTSSTAANIPAGYTAYRRLGSVLTDGSANILAFIQTGNEFQWTTPILDINDENTVTTRVTAAISSPPSFKCLAKINGYWSPNSTDKYCYVCDPDTTDLAPGHSSTPLSSLGGYAATPSSAQIKVMTNTSSQIAYRTGESGRAFRAATLGYVDRRMP